MKKYFILVFLFPVLAGGLVPSLAFAQCPSFSPFGLTCPIAACYGSGLNACTNLCQLLETVQNATFFGMDLVVFALAPIFLAWGAIMIIIAHGSPSALEGGKKILWSALIGILLAIGAHLIVSTFFFVLSLGGGLDAGFLNSTWPNIRCVL